MQIVAFSSHISGERSDPCKQRKVDAYEDQPFLACPPKFFLLMLCYRSDEALTETGNCLLWKISMDCNWDLCNDPFMRIRLADEFTRKHSGLSLVISPKST